MKNRNARPGGWVTASETGLGYRRSGVAVYFGIGLLVFLLGVASGLAADAVTVVNGIYTNVGGLTVAGPRDTWTVTNAGGVYSTALTFGTGNSNKLVVTGTGSVWTNNGASILYFGQDGRWNEVTIRNGGRFYSYGAGARIGSFGGNNSVLVTGSGSYLQFAYQDAAYVGYNSSDNRLVVTNGGTVYARAGLRLGGVAGANRNEVVVTGLGTGVTNGNSGGSYVGQAGACNKLTVSDSAYFVYETAQSLTIGYATATASNNMVLVTNGGCLYIGGGVSVGAYGQRNELIVTGSGSALTNNSGEFAVGDGGTYTKLTVADGGVVVNNGAIVFHIGKNAPSNSVVVSGANSALKNNSSGALWIGGNSGGSNNLLTVTNGGLVNSSSGIRLGNHAGAPGNAMVITGTGSVVNAGYLTVGQASASNRVEIRAGGLLEAPSLAAGAFPENTISNSGGIYQFASANPTITHNGYGRISLADGTLSFRGVTNANLTGNITNIAYAGINTLKLNNATNLSVSSLVFSTNRPFAFLELTNGRCQGTTVVFEEGGGLRGAGTVAAVNATNSGSIAPGTAIGTLVFTNNLTLTGTSVVQMELGGTGAGQWDRLAVNGALALDGSLVVSLADGFTPQPGDSFDLLDWGSLSATFSGGVTLPPGYAWKLNRLYDTGVISVNAQAKGTVISVR